MIIGLFGVFFCISEAFLLTTKSNQLALLMHCVINLIQFDQFKRLYFLGGFQRQMQKLDF